MLFKINFVLFYLLLVFYGISDCVERDPRLGLIRRILRKDFCKDVCSPENPRLLESRLVLCLRKCPTEMLLSHILDHNNKKSENSTGLHTSEQKQKITQKDDSNKQNQKEPNQSEDNTPPNQE